MEAKKSTAISFLADYIIHINAKVIFFILLGLITGLVFILLELPLVAVNDESHRRLVNMGWLLFPHAVFGLTALALGPFQFSTRLRKKNVRLHRLLGKIYVFAVFAGAILAIFVNLKYPIPGQTTKATVEILMQAFVWFITTLIAWLLAMKRQITLHKTWVARSYGVTFIFISSRIILVPPFTFFVNMDSDTFSVVLWFLLVLSLIVPEILLNWKEIFLNSKKKIKNEQQFMQAS